MARDQIGVRSGDMSTIVDAKTLDQFVDGPPPHPPEQMSFSFAWHTAVDYMRTMFHLEAQRDELNEAISTERTNAKTRGVPTKAVEAAVRAAKGRRKSAITPTEFRYLMDEAEKLLPKAQEVE